MLLLATRNVGKIREMKALLPGKILAADEYQKGLPEVVEDGSTLEENAVKKATTIARLTGQPCVADDTGLFVDALHGAPGIYAARFFGHEGDWAKNRQALLALMKDVKDKDRTASFKCIIALGFPDHSYKLFPGEVKGRITTMERGVGGFGYDPIFEVDGRTFAERTDKNQISHRALALRGLRDYLSTHPL